MARSYTDEFKQDAVNLVFTEGYSKRKAAECLGISAKTLENWVRKYRSSTGGVANVIERDELERENRRLREENRRLKLERDILKKATARRRRLECSGGAFAKESQ